MLIIKGKNMIDNVICMIIGLISGIIICIIIRKLNKHKHKLKSMEECLKNYNLNIDILNNNVEHLMQELKEYMRYMLVHIHIYYRVIPLN